MLIVVTGGARSGKSRFAVDRARRAGLGDVVFVATCPRIDGDGELERRIRDHRAERPPSWVTVEVELDLAAALGGIDERATVIVDCLTLWVSNLLVGGHDAATIGVTSDDALRAVASRAGETLVVTNEVGLGIVPADRLSREYRDILGRVNQAWVAAADRALFLVAGRALALHEPDDLLR
ncbi:MAG: bifunctional adenosylcobinamide kinase/adenosylcobinamide-phosphate guanylyltransferase [Acidimicrobiales bacterium]